MTEKITSAELRSALRHFSGTKQVYRHSLLRSVVYTDGVKYFAEKAGAYWFLDILATEPEIIKQAAEFACIILTVIGTKAKIVVTDGGDAAPVFRRDIVFTDCPEGEWKFYFKNNTILLPGES